MTPELALLKRLLNREDFTRYFGLVDLQGLRSQDKRLYDLYSVLEILHRTVDTVHASVADFEVFFYSQFPFLRESEKDGYAIIFTKLGALDVSDEITDRLVQSLRERATAARVARSALEVIEGRGSFDSLKDEAQSLASVEGVGRDQLQPVSSDLAALLAETYQRTGLRWRLESLNRRLGSIRPGDFGFVFARPETGKTTFLADQGGEFARQAKASNLGPVIWINNEELGSKVLIRVYQAYFQLQLPSLLASVRRYADTFRAELGDHFLLYDRSTVSRGDIEAVCAERKPSLVIIDQIDKVQGFKADRNDLELGEIYIWARQLAKEYCPVIGVCQADGTGEGVKWLTMAHVANAKTSKQAEADWILGIGKQDMAGYDSVRYLHLSKNKLFGDPDSDQSLRHDRWEVLIKPEIARYEDAV